MNPYARNLIVPQMRQDGTFDITTEGVTSLIKLINDKARELQLTYELFQQVGAITDDDMRRSLTAYKQAEDYFKQGMEFYYNRQFNYGLRFMADAFNTFRKATERLNDTATAAGYFMPNIKYLEQMRPLPPVSAREVDLLRLLAMQKQEIYKDYWTYIHNIGVQFDPEAEWWILGTFGAALEMLQEVLKAHPQTDPEILRSEYLASIYYLDKETDLLWNFTDPEGEGFGGIPGWVWSAYAEYTQEMMARRQPLGSAGERIKNVLSYAKAKGYLPGREPAPPPPSQQVYEFLRNPSPPLAATHAARFGVNPYWTIYETRYDKRRMLEGPDVWMRYQDGLKPPYEKGYAYELYNHGPMAHARAAFLQHATGFPHEAVQIAKNRGRDFPVTGRYGSLRELLDLMCYATHSHMVDFVFPYGGGMYAREMYDFYHGSLLGWVLAEVPDPLEVPVYYDRDRGMIFMFRRDGTLRPQPILRVSEEH